MKLSKYLFVLAFLLSTGSSVFAQLGGIEGLVTRKEYMVKMPDSVELATDIYLPILSQDLAVDNISVPIGGITTLTIPKLKLANKGVQFIQFKDQADPYQLPVVFTRTPYNKQSPEQGQVEAIMGYCGIIQDMRGRYASGGSYYPMYSDAWNKNPYYSVGHPLDTSANHIANTHEDGYNTIQYIANELRWDSDGDSMITPADRLVCNGKIGMIGASALANSQYSAAAVRKIDPDGRGLRCLVPIVGSGELYHCTGHQNGVYRERIIDGWLRGQVERYDWDTVSVDNSANNHIHSLSDFGPTIHTPREAAESAIDFWTTTNQAHYPNSPFRASMDIGAANIDANGDGDPNGTSRYANLEVPIYNITGWWDIFIDGQIESWQKTTANISERNRNLQKIVIGPWAHQTIGSQSTGDMRQVEGGPDNRYPVNVTQVIGASVDNLSASSIGELTKSEIIAWFRKTLGNPTIVFPPLHEWQKMGQVLGTDVYIKIPADTFELTFEEFFNFINGAGPLNNFPIAFKGVPFADTSSIQKLTIPATGNSLIGDPNNTAMQPQNAIEWDASKPNGVKPVRFYVIGPVNDSTQGDSKVGNYWYAADTFPIQNVQRQKMYLHQNGAVTDEAPTTDEGTLTYLNDPNNPVPTCGGAEMISYTPDGDRLSQGQMNFTDPKYINQVLHRPMNLINGDTLYDMLSFETDAVRDSFSIAGIPVVTLWAKTKPLSSIASDKSNCDFIVRILDVYPDGRELFVQDAAVNVRAKDYARYWAENGVEDRNVPWDNINSDQLYEFKFRMLPIAYTWGSGHKMKVLVSSSNYPRFQACPNVPLNQGEFFRRRPYEDKTYVYNGQELYPRKTINTLAFSSQFSGNIDFPVLGNKFLVGRDDATVNNNLLNVTLYPNPAGDMFAVSTNDLNRQFKATVYNLVGQQMGAKTFVNTVSFDVQSLPAGAYIVKIESTDGKTKLSKRLIKQ